MFITQRPYPEWKLIDEKTRHLPYGTLIPYSEIESAMGLRRSDPRFGANVQRWKKEMLREHQRPLLAVKNEGYRILTFDEIAPRAKHLMRLGVKAMARGVSVAEHAPFDQMPAEARRAITDLSVRTGMLVQLCREKLRELKIEGARESATPRVLKSAK